MRPDPALEAEKKRAAASRKAWSSFELSFFRGLIRVAEQRSDLSYTHLRIDLEPGWWTAHVDPADLRLAMRGWDRHRRLVDDLLAGGARREAAAARVAQLQATDGFRGIFWMDRERELRDHEGRLRSGLAAQGVHINDMHKHYSYGEVKAAVELDVARRYVIQSFDADVGRAEAKP